MAWCPLKCPNKISRLRPRKNVGTTFITNSLTRFAVHNPRQTFLSPVCSQNNDGTLRLSCKLGIHPDVASGPSHGYECGDTNSTVNTSQNCGYPCTASVNAPLMGDLQFTGEEKVVDWKLFKSSKFNSTRCIIFQNKRCILRRNVLISICDGHVLSKHDCAFENSTSPESGSYKLEPSSKYYSFAIYVRAMFVQKSWQWRKGVPWHFITV